MDPSVFPSTSLQQTSKYCLLHDELGGIPYFPPGASHPWSRKAWVQRKSNAVNRLRAGRSLQAVEEGETQMIVKCLACRQEMTMNHAKFRNYQGPVKCSACGAMMNVRSVRGVVGSIDLVGRRGSFLLRKTGWRGFQKPRPLFGSHGRFSPGKEQ